MKMGLLQIVLIFYVTIFYFLIYLFLEKNYSYRNILIAFILVTLSMCIPNFVTSLDEMVLMYMLAVPGLSGFIIYITRIPQKIRNKKFLALVPLLLWLVIFIFILCDLE